MNTSTAPAINASSMTFEEYKLRPVYKVHCKTTAIARALCGIRVEASMGLATAGSDANGLTTFRALTPYRSVQANALRHQVCKAIQHERKELRESRQSQNNRIAELQEALSNEIDSVNAINRRAVEEGIDPSFEELSVDLSNSWEVADLADKLPGYESAVEELAALLGTQNEVSRPRG